jgi:hypothetical protein
MRQNQASDRLVKRGAPSRFRGATRGSNWKNDPTPNLFQTYFSVSTLSTLTDLCSPTEEIGLV